MSEVIRPVAGAAMPETETEARPDLLPAPERLRPRVVLAVAIAQFGTAVPAVSMVLVSWPITIARLAPAEKAFYLGLLSGVFALLQIFAAPISGVLSDRCGWRIGMRRPFLLGGALIGLAGMLLMAVSNSIATLIAGAAVYAIGSGVFAGGNSALVPDQVPDRHRGKLLGLSGMVTAIAGVVTSIVIPQFIGNQFVVFFAPGIAMVAGGVIAAALIRDRRLDRSTLSTKPTLRGLLDQFKVRPRDIPDFSWAWIGKAVTTLGTVLTTVYGVYFLTDHLNVGAAALPGVLTATGLIGLATAVLGAAVGSWISDRLRIRKKMVLYTSSLILIGALIAAFAPSVPIYMVALLIMGFGTGAYFPVDGAVMVDVLPGEGKETGKYMGLMTLADQVPRSIGPFVAAGVLALANLIPNAGYPGVFVAGGVIAIIGALLIRKVKGSH